MKTNNKQKMKKNKFNNIKLKNNLNQIEWKVVNLI